MPLLRKPVLLPLVGLDYMNPSTMINDRGGYPKNMRLHRNDIKKREGKTLLGVNPQITGAGPVIHLAQYVLSSQTIRLLRFSHRIVEKYNVASGVWEDVTGVAFTGDYTDFFSNVTAENKIIISNYIDKMRFYDDSGTTQELVATSGATPKAKYLEYNNGYLLAGYCTEGGTEYPTKVAWSDIGDITKWGSGNAGSTLLYHDPLPIRGLKNLNEYTVGYKKNSIYLGRSVDTSDVFKFDLAYTGVGLLTNRALVDFKGKHYFMGTGDFYTFNGMTPVSIADNTVKKEVFSRLDSNKSNRCFAVLMEDMDEIWFFVAISGNEWPTEIWKYNIRTGYWYFDTCNPLCSAQAYYQQASISWHDLIGTWDQQNWRWDDQLTTTDFPYIVFGDSTGLTSKHNPFVHNDNGTVVDASWESMDFTGDRFENYKRWLQLEFEAKGNSVDIEYSTDYGDTWKTIKVNFQLTNNWPTKPYKVDLDVVARHIRFRFRNNRTGETFYLRQFYPYYLQREECSR